MAKSWKSVKELRKQSEPQDLSESDSFKYTTGKRNSSVLVKKTEIAQIPDYFSADKADFDPISELEFKLDSALPLVPLDDHSDPQSFSDQFEYWTEILTQNFNIALYGVGSKISTLSSYQNYLNEHEYTIIRVNAYNPVTTVKKILLEICKLHMDYERKNTNLDSLLTTVLDILDNSDFAIFLLIDSIDSVSLIHPESQLVLSRLANHCQIHFLASLDNPYLLYRWSLDTNIKYNFLYIPCATLSAYTTELSFTDGLKVFEYSSTHNQLRGVEYVLKSLTPLQRSVLKELAYIQIKEPNGISMKDFLNRCMEETLVTNSKNLKESLAEAVDHNIAGYKPGAKGESMIFLKIDPVFLTNNIV